MIKASLREATNSSLIADIVATDRHGQPVLIAEVKRGKAGRDAKRQLRRELAAVKNLSGCFDGMDGVFLRNWRVLGRRKSSRSTIRTSGRSEFLSRIWSHWSRRGFATSRIAGRGRSHPA